MKEKFLSNLFKFSIEGIEFKHTVQVSGIDVNINKIRTFNNNSDKAGYRKGTSYVDDFVVVKEMSDFETLKWFLSCVDGKVTQRPASLIIYNENSNEVGRYTLENIWPIAYNAPDFRANGTTSIALETITFACEGVSVG